MATVTSELTVKDITPSVGVTGLPPTVTEAISYPLCGLRVMVAVSPLKK